MTYTVSHRQGGVTRADVAGLIRHEFRDVDRHNGVETQHSNERIIPERTHLNVSWMWRGGEKVELTNSRQILEELDSRLENAGGQRVDKKTGKTVHTKVRKDAGVVRDIVLQLDPDFTGRSGALVSLSSDQEHRDRVGELYEEMIDHYAELYGRENLLAASLHLDETNPHIHLLLTPIDDQGRVRQQSFIAAGKGPKSGMAKNDRAMRSRLKNKGYDVDPEPIGGGRKHMSVDEYAKFKAREGEVEGRQAEVEDRSMMIRRQVEALDDREASVRRQEAAVRAREDEVARREAEAAKTAQKAAQRLSEADGLYSKTSELLRELEMNTIKVMGKPAQRRVDELRGEVAEARRVLLNDGAGDGASRRLLHDDEPGHAAQDERHLRGPAT